MEKSLPLVLVLDDLFGRNLAEGRNGDRENLCAQFMWRDITGDSAAKASQQRIPEPVADAVFFRAQLPVHAQIGDAVENDLPGALAHIRDYWQTPALGGGLRHAQVRRASMLLVDLCFYTGSVTAESDLRAAGMPLGRQQDSDPRTYFGLEILTEVRRAFPDLPIFALSSMPRQAVTLDLSRRGALGFIDRTSLEGPAQFSRALDYHGLFPDPAGVIIGTSLPILLALREARRAAHHRQDLLIRGERGTGKELFAQFIHRSSAAHNGGRASPLVAVNSPALSPSLFAAELYGIEPGSATGVVGRRGLLETADGGDVFLDEVTDLALEAQASLLRVLQERQVTPVGGRRPKSIAVRIIAATNADLDDPTAGLRADLLDRLRVGGTIWLPPLRDRIEDIPLLAERFVRDAEARRAVTLRREISCDAVDKLLSYDWPGNIRELQTVVADAVSRFPDVEHLVADHLRIGTADHPTATRRSCKIAIKVSSTTKIEAPIESSIDALLQHTASISFHLDNLSDWAGKLGVLQDNQHRLIARMLLVSLEATKRRTPQNPSGILQIHPAIKLLTGDTGISATQAADTVKRLLGAKADELEGDLKEAYDIAVRLRPKRGRTLDD
jgi:DNA-binding NtrC family response regulator